MGREREEEVRKENRGEGRQRELDEISEERDN